MKIRPPRLGRFRNLAEVAVRSRQTRTQLSIRLKGFSYVGACQVLMGVYVHFSHGLSWLVHSPLSFFLKEGSERSNMLSFLVLTSQTPRGANSAIRAQEGRASGP